MATTYAPLATVPSISRKPNRLARLAAWFAACSAHSRQRQTLSLLTDDELKDIGLSRTDVGRECGRWPWDGPMLGRLTCHTPRPYRAIVRSMT